MELTSPLLSTGHAHMDPREQPPTSQPEDVTFFTLPLLPLRRHRPFCVVRRSRIWASHFRFAVRPKTISFPSSTDDSGDSWLDRSLRRGESLPPRRGEFKSCIGSGTITCFGAASPLASRSNTRMIALCRRLHCRYTDVNLTIHRIHGHLVACCYCVQRPASAYA